MVQEKGIHVLALVTEAFGGFGGIAQYNRDFLSALAGSEDVSRITILPRTATAPSSLPSLKLKQLPPVSGRLAYVVRSVAFWRQARRIDTIFCGHLFMMPVAALIARFFRASLWLQIHGIDAWERPSRLLQWSVKQADMVTSVSRYTRRRFLSWALITPEKVKVLPNTIHRKFCPGPKSSDLLDRYGLHGNQVLLTVSRLAASEGYKGHDRVIKALTHVLAVYPKTLYLIAGDGDDRPRLEDLALRNGVLDRVIFAGQVPEKELVAHFRVADVFIMPSVGEGFGIVFLQAAACGLKVVAGNRDGSVDALADGELGQLVDPLDEIALADAIKEALNSESSPSAEALQRFRLRRFNESVSGLVRHAS